MQRRLIATSVAREGGLGGPGTGVFLVDLEQPAVQRAAGLERPDIDFRRRGAERGFRGVAFDGDLVFLAAGDELFAFTPACRLVESWRNRWLKQCRAMCVFERSLFVVSSTYDSVLAFDLDRREFTWALRIELRRFRFSVSPFDPREDAGPLPLTKLGLTDIYCNGDGMYVSGYHTGGMLHFSGDRIQMAAQLPPCSHNPRPFRKGVLFIDNDAGKLRYCGRDGGCEDRALPLWPERDPSAPDPSLATDKVRPLGRGLCLLDGHVAAVGTSPSTVTLFDLQGSRRLGSIALSGDLHDAIHGLEVWPFDTQVDQ